MRDKLQTLLARLRFDGMAAALDQELERLRARVAARPAGDVCRGRRYNHETLQVKYKDKSIADLLEMPVEDALSLLENIPQIRAKLETLIASKRSKCG